jgi:hypothetical protein
MCLPFNSAATGRPRCKLTILWEKILKRFPPIEVVEKPKRAYSSLIHGITEMKVRIPA